jgi:hypothetical protein
LQHQRSTSFRARDQLPTKPCSSWQHSCRKHYHKLHMHTQPVALYTIAILCGSESSFLRIFYENFPLPTWPNNLNWRSRQRETIYFISWTAFCIRLSASASPLVSGWGRGSTLVMDTALMRRHMNRSSISLRSPRLLISDCLQYTCLLTRSLACLPAACSAALAARQSDAAL